MARRYDHQLVAVVVEERIGRDDECANSLLNESLLCSRRERPRRRAADQRDELVALHSISSVGHALQPATPPSPRQAA
jgi:hypothetical protein